MQELVLLIIIDTNFIDTSLIRTKNSFSPVL